MTKKTNKSKKPSAKLLPFPASRIARSALNGEKARRPVDPDGEEGEAFIELIAQVTVDRLARQVRGEFDPDDDLPLGERVYRMALARRNHGRTN